MKKTGFLLLLIVTALSLFGFQIMGAGATVHGMKAVVRELPGTFVMAGEGMYLLAWPQGTAYAYTIIDAAGKGVNLNALKVAADDAAALTASLMTRGWQMVSARVLPQSLRAMLSGPSVYAILSQMSGSLPTIAILPAIMVPTPLPKY